MSEIEKHVVDAEAEAEARRIAAEVETGPREPASRFTTALITLLCLAWSGFQLYIAFRPINAIIARAWHLAFAIALVYLAYPLYKHRRPPFWLRGLQRLFPRLGTRPHREYVPVYDFVFAAVAAGAALYIWWDYEGIVMRSGLPTRLDVWMGVVMIVFLLEAARRALGPALPTLCLIFLVYTFAGPYMPEILRHRGIPLEFVINDMYLSDTGIFGVPLGVSTSFVFLFVLFGALLDKAGAGKYFIDVAFAGLGGLRGGPAKACVVASGLTGLVSGSSIANTVTTGTFTIPLMKKVGLPAYKAGAVEVAASTNGQLMPPIMGAAAFIMAEILGIPYLDVVRAAFFPAVISYMALFYVVHLEAVKLGIQALPRSELPPFLKTVLRGLHYVIPLAILILFLVVLRRSAIQSALLAIEALVVIMLVQRPIMAYLALGARRRAGTLDPETRLGAVLGRALLQGLRDIWDGLIAGARNMIAVGVATAAAGIIVGVVTITGLVGRFVTVIEVISLGNVYLMLILTALTSIVLGMGLPTTANYIIMATLTAPVIVHLGADAGLVFPLIAAHLFVFYFGILADDTPPVGLAAYAAAAIARADPIRTGIQGFTYDLRTAILPFVFIFNLDLLMIAGATPDGGIIWETNALKIAFVFVASLAAMFAFASFMQGWSGDRCSWPERLLLLAIAIALFRPGLYEELVPVPDEAVQAATLLLYGLLYLHQKARHRRRTAAQAASP
ncbi:TRAP transporter permease [Inmirania thermothiophila]|uniref:TRAP transporter 4TM/12TM fusion protein n=1 Tax=Inmirania thermothiophila TaxID=1750597 RepID=A0A3N1Y5I7_9GAMM|nr:TRAP transporter permease [Inmirania thermothiophila]ROR32882.1 TRAP transporter 4TM/12TM fusion protein [Inmirania thermothiophila]